MKNNRESDVIINLMAIARYDSFTEYPIQFITRGTLSRPEKEKYILSYTETQPEGENGEMVQSDIELTMEKGRVTMVRKGDFTATMAFAREQPFEGVYSTPYGDMQMAVYTHYIHSQLGEDSGSVHLKYQISIQGSYTSTNELHLEYRTEDKGKAQ